MTVGHLLCTNVDNYREIGDRADDLAGLLLLDDASVGGSSAVSLFEFLRRKDEMVMVKR